MHALKIETRAAVGGTVLVSTQIIFPTQWGTLAGEITWEKTSNDTVCVLGSCYNPTRIFPTLDPVDAECALATPFTLPSGWRLGKGPVELGGKLYALADANTLQTGIQALAQWWTNVLASATIIKPTQDPARNNWSATFWAAVGWGCPNEWSDDLGHNQATDKGGIV